MRHFKKHTVSCSLLFLALVLGFAGFFHSPAASAATYYVRSDGGTDAQCNGTANTAYSAAVAPACAWSSPNYALPLGKTNGTAQRIKASDTLSIGPGTYNVGLGAPTSNGCFANASYDCFSKPIPSGTTAIRTRIIGLDANGTCSAPPKLVGVGADLYAVLNLEASSNVEINCLEITDASQCIKAHNHFGTARGETARCGTTDNYAQYGIVSRNSSNVLLTNLNIHGLAVNGIRAGALTNWTMTGVKIIANGWAGWDGDIAPGDQIASSNSGTITFRNSEIAWNGCGERLDAARTKFGCWAQENGGYGDGLGTGRTGGNWLFEDVSIHHNTSDGLDLLYMNGTGTVTVRRMRSQGNAGNQIKVAGTSLIENSVAISNCSFFATFPTSNLSGGENCRAMGNALSVNLIDNSVATVRHNTVTGEGDCQLITVGGNTSARVLVQNNAFLGDIEYQSRSYGPELSCGHYAESSVAAVQFENNLFWNVKNGQCPSGSICKDPKLTQIAYEAFDATPLAGSPLIDAAIVLPAVLTDFFDRARPYGPKPDIGAIEVQPAPTMGGRVSGGILPPRRATGVTAAGNKAMTATSPATDSTNGSTSLPATAVTPWRSRGATLVSLGKITVLRLGSMFRTGIASMTTATQESIAAVASYWNDALKPSKSASATATALAKVAVRIWSKLSMGQLLASKEYEVDEQAAGRLMAAAKSNKSSSAIENTDTSTPSSHARMEKRVTNEH